MAFRLLSVTWIAMFINYIGIRNILEHLSYRNINSERSRKQTGPTEPPSGHQTVTEGQYMSGLQSDHKRARRILNISPLWLCTGSYCFVQIYMTIVRHAFLIYSTVKDKYIIKNKSSLCLLWLSLKNEESQALLLEIHITTERKCRTRTPS